ncbi:Sec31p [Lachancea thermotolerans CBS 6340]|uniref:Protein transport protein SEC31 n=1 Tax=Lachancea thermotolerans (strain ATCC 56472 / CBS 6340 / NRRL Y-8284) TaxID=559295 RepID=C5E249_LACTC|nr:KLTH0H02134p [Lachancea thermotolerans CBS 6340]CAR30110.1 KLTH0H02134p [Lachancea thermotolerans CBS 6340]
MVKLAEYPRTATFAWSYDRSPLLATGTASGTIDADFSSESTLEIWSLLSPHEATPQASITADAKFNDLDWSHDNAIIAGALENGVVEFFAPEEPRSVAKLAQHTTPVKTVTFNARQHNVLCSGGSKGEIYIWDANKIETPGYAPFVPGTAMTPMDEIYSLAWNQNQAHVFASAGSSGYASIWDLKAKKEVIHLSYASPVTGQRNQLSIVEWHPNNSTRIATASGNDSDPSILIWDLRNANVPMQVLSQPHTKGVLSLDWCKQDETLLLSSGRDNVCVLWNPEEGQSLTQYPTRGNWCFKTKFAPQTPDLFASASFDNKIEVQTLQNVTCSLDTDATATKQRESETEFWNNVSVQDANEKPIVKKLQAPAWYGNKSQAAQWAFGGKLVQITSDKKGVKISKPAIPGAEKNVLLDKALETKDFNPIINKRLVQSIDATNEEDWNLLEKLSLDGKDAFLSEALAFDDEDTDETKEKDVKDDGGDFFSSLNEKFVPEGSFRLDASDKLNDLFKSLVRGDKKSAISSALEQDLLLESLLIALDSDDQTLKQKVKNAYFTKHGKTSSLARVLHCVSEGDADDLVKNIEVDQWKYAVKAIDSYTSDLSKKNELFIALGDRLSDAGNRQDALLLYLSAQSLDKVASIWLKEFVGLESKLESKKETVYEAHLECLTEFVERFTVFISLISDDQHQSLANEELIAKFLEFVNLTSSNGDFDLALKFLEILPGDNEDVVTEKQRVLIASNKLPSAATKSQKPRYAGGNVLSGTSVAGLGLTNDRTPGGVKMPPAQPMQTVNPSAPFAPSTPFNQQTPLRSRAASFAAPAPELLKSNPYAPASTQATTGSKYAPPPITSPSSAPRGSSVASSVPITHKNAGTYAPAVAQPSVAGAVPPNPYAPSAGAYGNFSGQPAYSQPLKPVANVIGASAPGANSMSPPLAPPASNAASGQTPHLNKNANDGWNDLPLNVKEKPTRAKAVSVAPVSVAPSSAAPGPQVNFGSIPPPPLSRVTSSANLQTPVPQRVPSKTYTPPNGSASPASVNPYAPPLASAAPAPVVPSNPYAPSAVSTGQPVPGNPYAPAAAMPSNPYASPPPNGAPQPHLGKSYGPGSGLNGLSAPPASQKAPIGPPPKHMKRRTHASNDIDSANAILESVQKRSEAPTPQVGGAPPTSIPKNQPLSEVTSSGTTPAPLAAEQGSSSGIPVEQQPIVDFLSSELGRVTPLIPQEYTKQLKDCNKRLRILFGHLERQDLLTQPTVDKLHSIVALMKERRYADAMQVHVDIATNHAQEAGNWLTGVKRLIGIAEVTSS